MSRPVKLKEALNCVCLQAIIKETMRLSRELSALAKNSCGRRFNDCGASFPGRSKFAPSFSYV